MSAYLRNRQYGYYFHFKLLAFTGPLIVAGRGGRRRAAAAGRPRAARRARAWPRRVSAFMELKATGSPARHRHHPAERLGQAAAGATPRSGSTCARADELWAAYFLASHPVCSQLPLLATDYPHVTLSRKADYILAAINVGRPADAIGPPLADQQLLHAVPREPVGAGRRPVLDAAPEPAVLRRRPHQVLIPGIERRERQRMRRSAPARRSDRCPRG